jgi:hypothetical protein
VHECLDGTTVLPADTQNPNIHEAWTKEPVAHTRLTAAIFWFTQERDDFFSAPSNNVHAIVQVGEHSASPVIIDAMATIYFT